MGVTWLGALVITGGLGVIDHDGWIRANGGDRIGKVSVSQSIAETKLISTALTAEHISSTNSGDDTGINTLMLEVSYKIRW